MSDLSVGNPTGVLRRGWSAAVGDYAIAGGWSQNGEVLMVGDAEGGVYALDGKSGEIAWERPGAHEGGMLAMAVHPSRTAFATAGQDGRVLIWSPTDGEVSRAIDVGSDWVENVAWSPDGQWLAASCSRQVRVYDADGGVVWESDDHPSTVSAIAWSRGAELATACYGRVSFFDPSTGVAAPEDGVAGVSGFDGTQLRRGRGGLRQPGQHGPLLAPLHGDGLHDVGVSRQALGPGF